MIQKILEIKHRTIFDFREYANPDDELSYLFNDWVDYYRLKFSICNAIDPKTILEIGVRYGYSAITFLNACQDAVYLGIDNDSNTFGGSAGSINWAKRITQEYNAKFIIANTQSMKSLPDSYYDFIHIDGQQDGDGTFHDLELALERGRYILLDGYFWSTENMLSAAFFLKKYKQFIEYAEIIPGYAGELLIKTKESSKDLFCKHKEKKYFMLSDQYDADYFMRDCGGYDIFARSNGQELDDRLSAAYNLINPIPGDNILDLGCGRGELSFSLSQTGANVTGIDYSKEALEIADKTYSFRKNNLNLKYMLGDVCNLNLGLKYDKIVASDLIEHIDAESIGGMLSGVSKSLKDNGIFVVHTSPNHWNYKYSYKRKRKTAKHIGLWLPENPRSYYEDLMHVNEQNPIGLKKVLNKYFENVIVWVATLPDTIGSLTGNYTISQKCAATSIFAIASDKKIDRAVIIKLLSQQKLKTEGLNVEILCSLSDLKVKKSQRFGLSITVLNMGRERISSMEPYPINISYHWIKENGQIEIYDGERTPFRTSLQPNEQRDMQMNVVSPAKEGNYVLQVTMVQENCFWFEQAMCSLPVYIKVKVE
jgi:2-polyprenyl-3-methyl-5-hydroxy-6-metoxy-1,4-benzoquinol methylase